MAIDQIGRVGARGVRVQHRPQLFGQTTRAGILHIDIADQRCQPRILCPLAQRLRGFKGIAVALGAGIQHPAQFLFGEKRAGVDADLTKAAAGGAVLDHQRAAAEEIPLRVIGAEHPPSGARRERSAHEARPV